MYTAGAWRLLEMAAAPLPGATVPEAEHVGAAWAAHLAYRWAIAWHGGAIAPIEGFEAAGVRRAAEVETLLQLAWPAG